MPLSAFRQNRSGEEVIQIALRLGLLAALILWCFVLVRPFIGILAWSVVLAVALYPVYAWLSGHLGRCSSGPCGPLPPRRNQGLAGRRRAVLRSMEPGIHQS